MDVFKKAKLVSVVLPGKDVNAHAEALWHDVCDRVANFGDAGAKLKESVRKLSSFLESLRTKMSRWDMDSVRAQLREGLERAYLVSVGHLTEASEVKADAKKWRRGVMLMVSQRSKYMRSSAGSKCGRPRLYVTATHPQPSPVGAGSYARQSAPVGSKARRRVSSGANVHLAASSSTTKTAGSKRRRPGGAMDTPGTHQEGEEEAGAREGAEMGAEADEDGAGAADGDVEDDNEVDEDDDGAKTDEDEDAGGGAAGSSAACTTPVSVRGAALRVRSAPVLCLETRLQACAVCGKSDGTLYPCFLCQSQCHWSCGGAALNPLQPHATEVMVCTKCESGGETECRDA